MSQRKKNNYWNLDKWCNSEIETLMSTGPELITEKELKRRAKIKADEKNWKILDLNCWWILTKNTVPGMWQVLKQRVKCFG